MACSKCSQKKQATTNTKKGCSACGTNKNTNKNIRTRGTR